jgi:hypothetical protein
MSWMCDLAAEMSARARGVASSSSRAWTLNKPA